MYFFEERGYGYKTLKVFYYNCTKGKYDEGC